MQYFNERKCFHKEKSAGKIMSKLWALENGGRFELRVYLFFLAYYRFCSSNRLMFVEK